jgi:ribosomal protein S18 acetylase RimI-like enzyme
MLLQPAKPNEREELLTIAVRTGLFSREEAEGLLGSVLEELAAERLPEGHATVTCRATPDGPVMGWAYFAPDPYADRVWNLWWIGVLPEHQGTGAGRALLTHAESVATQAGARVLVIETSDLEPMARARRFYLNASYSERGRIPDFYSKGEAKVIFSRSLPGAA